MSEDPVDTWELAEQLEALAKQLKKAPRFVLAQRREIKIRPLTDRTPSQNYGELKVVELKKECRKRGIRGYSKLRKSELVKLLEEDDSGITMIDKISVAFKDKTE